jgi:hypothetical protein
MNDIVTCLTPVPVIQAQQIWGLGKLIYTQKQIFFGTETNTNNSDNSKSVHTQPQVALGRSGGERGPIYSVVAQCSFSPCLLRTSDLGCSVRAS